MGLTLASQDGQTTNTTPVDVMPAPASGAQNMLLKLTVNNRDSGPITVTIQKKHGANTRVIITDTLQAGDPPLLWTAREVNDDTDKTLQVVLAGTPGTEADWDCSYMGLS